MDDKLHAKLDKVLTVVQAMFIELEPLMSKYAAHHMQDLRDAQKMIQQLRIDIYADQYKSNVRISDIKKRLKELEGNVEEILRPKKTVARLARAEDDGPFYSEEQR